MDWNGELKKNKRTEMKLWKTWCILSITPRGARCNDLRHNVMHRRITPPSCRYIWLGGVAERQADMSRNSVSDLSIFSLMFVYVNDRAGIMQRQFRVVIPRGRISTRLSAPKQPWTGLTPWVHLQSADSIIARDFVLKNGWITSSYFSRATEIYAFSFKG